MKSIADIDTELEKNNWSQDDDIKNMQDVLLPALSKILDDEETVKSQVWGYRVIEQELTDDIQVMTLTNKRIITIYKNLGTRSEKIKANSQPIKNVTKSKIIEPKKEKGYVDFQIQFENNSSVTTRVDDYNVVKHFEQELKQDNSNNKQKLISKDFLKSAFKSNKSYLTNSNIWYGISILMTLAILIISAVLIGDTENKSSIWVPAGILEAIFAIIDAIAMLVIIANNWDKYKFSPRLYTSCLWFLLDMFIFIISIIAASKTSMGKIQGFEIAILIISVLNIFDNGYYFSKDVYLMNREESVNK